MEKIWKSAILITGLALFLVACGSERTDSDAGEQSPMEIAPLPADETAPAQQQQQQQQQQPPGEVNIPAGSDGIVHHYICVDRCEGGHSENPGFCSVCNKQLAHNRAWHEQGQQQQQQPGQADPRVQFDPMRGGGETAPAQQQQQQQQQQQMQQVNIPAGPDGIVHHYICIDQCAGGHSENPGFCAVCNKQLAHNQAWHNQ